MASILRVKSLRGRNLIRGIVSAESAYQSRAAFNRLRQEVDPVDLASAVANLYSTTGFDTTAIFPDFPDELRSGIGWRRMECVPLQSELALQITRINQFDLKLDSALSALLAINQHIFCGLITESTKLIDEFIGRFGLSQLALRKIAVLHAMAPENEAVSELVKKFTARPAIGAFTTHYSQMYELFEPSEQYYSVLRKWSDMLEKSRVSPWVKDLYASNLWIKCFDPEEFRTRLQTLSNISLLDTFIFIVTTNHDLSNPSSIESSDGENSNICSLLLESFASKFAKPICPTELIWNPDNTDGWDDNLIRRAAAFPEYQAIANWKSAIDKCIRERVTGLKKPSDAKISVDETEYFPQSLTPTHLVSSGCTPKHTFERYDNESANFFERTVALVSCINNGQTILSLVDEDLTFLLGKTSYLSNLLNRDEISALVAGAQAQNRLVISFLSTCMLFEASPSDDLDFQLRYALQMVIMEEFAGDLIRFLDWVHPRTSEISRVIVQYLDMSFLERMYLLMRTFDDVVNLRIRLCYWVAENLKRTEYTDMAKRLEIDNKVRKIKGSIDDTRIYVDEMRFNSWAEDNLKSDIRRMLNSGLSLENPVKPNMISSRRNFEILDINDDLGSAYWMYYMCSVAFREFCSNKIYGVTSYLSRRIRHGTMEGFLSAPVRQLFAADEFSELQSDPRYVERREFWLSEYKLIIEGLRDRRLYFVEEGKPEGFFSWDIFSSVDRFTAVYTFVDAFYELIKAGRNEQELPREFSAMCWSCLETDLIKVGRFIRTVLCEKVKMMTSNYLVYENNSEKLHSLRVQLNSLVTARFEEFANWFTKPTSVSLSASVRELGDTALSEVTSYVENFNPNVVYLGDVDASLHGGVYHTLYDCLFILIENAAKYGKKCGSITVEVATERGDVHDTMQVAVTSEHTEDPSAVAYHNARIVEAAHSENVTAAMTKEGFSGIKRVRRIALEEWVGRPGVSGDPAERSFVCIADGHKVCIAVQIPIRLV